MSTPRANPACPYPGWERRMYRLPRPVSMSDIQAFLGDEDSYIRDTVSGPVHIIHKYGLLEIHALAGRKRIEVWYNPDKGAYPSEYLDALISTRF